MTIEVTCPSAGAATELSTCISMVGRIRAYQRATFQTEMPYAVFRTLEKDGHAVPGRRGRVRVRQVHEGAQFPRHQGPALRPGPFRDPHRATRSGATSCCPQRPSPSSCSPCPEPSARASACPKISSPTPSRPVLIPCSAKAACSTTRPPTCQSTGLDPLIERYAELLTTFTGVQRYLCKSCKMRGCLSRATHLSQGLRYGSRGADFDWLLFQLL